MEYNKKLFTKANDKKVLHKVKKQWVVLSMALLAAFGAKALASHTVNADTTPAAGSTTTSQANSSKSASNVHLVNSQSNVNVNHQNNDQANQSVQGRQATSSLSSAQIMKQATQIHQHVLNTAAHNLGNAKLATLDTQSQAGTKPQSGSKNTSFNQQPIKQGGQTLTTQNSKQKSTNTNANQQNQGTIPIKIQNADLDKVMANVNFVGNRGTTYSVNQVWKQINHVVPGYRLSSDTYSDLDDPSANFAIPTEGNARKQTIYVKGDYIKSIPINLILRVANSQNGLKLIQIPNYKVDGDAGNVTINPSDLLKNDDYASYFTDRADGNNFAQRDYDTTMSDKPVSFRADAQGRIIPLQSDGKPYPNNTVTFDYVRHGVSENNPTGLPVIYTLYFDRALYDWSKSPMDNMKADNQVLHSIKSDMRNPSDPNIFKPSDRRNDIPKGYYYVKDINGHYQKYTNGHYSDFISSDPTPTKFGDNNTTKYYNVEIAKDAKVIYQIISSDGKGHKTATPLTVSVKGKQYPVTQAIKGFNTNDGTNNLNHFSLIPSSAHQGYHFDNNEYDSNNPAKLFKAYTTQNAYQSNDPKSLLTSTVANGGTYYVNLYPDTAYLNIDYIDAEWPEYVVAKNEHNPFKGPYQSKLDNGVPYPNAEYISNNISDVKNSDGTTHKWTIPSGAKYNNPSNPKDPLNGKLLTDIFDNTVYSFNSTDHNNTVTVPVNIPNEYATRFIYEDTSNNDTQVGKPIYIVNNSDYNIKNDYQNYSSESYIKNNSDLKGYTADTPANSHYLSKKLPPQLQWANHQTEPIYIKPISDGTIIVHYVKNDDTKDPKDQFTQVTAGTNQPKGTKFDITPFESKNIPDHYHFDKVINNTASYNSGTQNVYINLVPNQSTITISYFDKNNNQIGKTVPYKGTSQSSFNPSKMAKKTVPQGYTYDYLIMPSNNVTQFGDNDQRVKVRVTRDKGTVVVNYLYNGKNVGSNSTINDYNTPFNQNGAVNAGKTGLKAPYKNYAIKSVKTENPKGAPVNAYGDNDTQTINVDLVDALQGTVQYKYKDENGHDELVNGNDDQPITYHTSIENQPTNISADQYIKEVPQGYHLDASDPIENPINGSKSAWNLNDNDKNFYVNVVRDSGKITITYEINDHSVDYRTDENKNANSPIVTIQNYGDGFNQAHMISDHMTEDYQNHIKNGYKETITTPNPNNAAVKSYGDNTTQNIIVNLTKNVNGKVIYVDVDNQDTQVGQKMIPSDSVGTPVDINKFNTRSDIPSGYLLSSDNPTNTVNNKDSKKNWKLNSDSNMTVYPIKVDEAGQITVNYITDMDPNHVLTKYSQTITGPVKHGFNWSKYTDEIPAGYEYYKVLPNSVDSFEKTPQTVDIDVVKPTNQNSQPVKPSDENVTVEYKNVSDVNAKPISAWSFGGQKNEGISDTTYQEHMPNGYQFDHYDPSNQNKVVNGDVDIVWIKKPSTPTPTPQSQQPTSQQGTITVQYQNSDGTPIKQTMSQSDVGHLFDKANLQNRPAPAGYHWTLLGGNNVGYYQAQPQQVTLRLVHDTPQPSSAAQPSSSAAPQSRATKPVHHTRGNIGVTYEGAHGNVLGKKSYRGDVGAAFMPNTTPKRGYHFEIVRGNNVNEFKDHKQNVVMKLVKNQKSASTTSAPSSQATPSDSTSRNYGGTSHSASSRTSRYGKQVNGVSHRRSMSSFDHALDQEVTMAHHHNGKKLPQTGEGQSDAVEAMGMILLAISAVFIAGYDFEAKRRRHN